MRWRKKPNKMRPDLGPTDDVMTYGRQVLGERTAPRIRSAEGRGNVVMRMRTQQQQPDLHNSIITHPSVSLKISSSCPFLKSNGDEARSPIIFLRNGQIRGLSPNTPQQQSFIVRKIQCAMEP